MVRNIVIAFSVVVTLTALVLPIGTAAAQSTTPGSSSIVSGGNPDPKAVAGNMPEAEIILSILLSTIPAA